MNLGNSKLTERFDAALDAGVFEEMSENGLDLRKLAKSLGVDFSLGQNVHGQDAMVLNDCDFNDRYNAPYLTSKPGWGSSPSEALRDLEASVAGDVLVVNGFTPELRREIRLPSKLAQSK